VTHGAARLLAMVRRHGGAIRAAPLAQELWLSHSADTHRSGAGLAAQFVKWCKLHGESWDHEDAAFRFARAKMTAGDWAASTAATALSKIPAAMSAELLIVMDTGESGVFASRSRPQRRRALARGRPDASPRHRPPIAESQVRAAARLLACGGDGGEPAPDLAGLLMLVFSSMLRATAIDRLTAEELVRTPAPAASMLVCRPSKTRLERHVRGQWTPVGPAEAVWAAALWRRRQRLHTRGGPQAALLPSAARRRLLAALRRQGAPPGGGHWNLANLRPGGNMRWLEGGLDAGLRQAAGGWAKGSKANADAYTTLGPGTAPLFAAATRASRDRESGAGIGEGWAPPRVQPRGRLGRPPAALPGSAGQARLGRARPPPRTGRGGRRRAAGGAPSQ